MKRIYAPTTLLLSLLMMSGCSHSQNEFSAPEGPYLGQKTPGSTPEAFAPGIISTKIWEYGGTFTPDMKEFYFLRENVETKKHEIVVFQNKNCSSSKHLRQV